MDVFYHIDLVNFEIEDVQIQIQHLNQPEAPPGTIIDPVLLGAEFPVILESVELDDDKTAVIKGRKLTCGFLSTDEDGLTWGNNVDSFKDGDEDNFLVRLALGSGPHSVPFIGNLVLDDITEAFQPRPNPVSLCSGEGLGSLKGIELTESDGDVPTGHYRIIDYIYLCLRHLMPGQAIHVCMNLYEVDTDPDVSHAFSDTHLHSLTFETDANKRDDWYTVLTKILDAFGCFITYDNDGWWIIRWDEYDLIGTGITTLRFANFSDDGTFQDFENISVDKIIAHDGDVLYEGYRLSFDNAVKRFQRRAHSVTHTYKLEQPKEIPCNSAFLRGTVDDDVLPLKTYFPECWVLFRGWGANSTTPNSVAQIWVRFDANGYETERYLTLTPQSSSGGLANYVVSAAIPIDIKDKFEFSFDYSADSDNGVNGPLELSIAGIVLYGDDNSVWILWDNATPAGPGIPEWKLTDEELSTNADFFAWYFSASSGSEDYREWKNYSIEAPPAPVAGKLYIHFLAANQHASAIDDFVIRYNNLQFTYLAYINGSYHTITALENKVTGDNISRKNIEHEMFIGDSPKKLYKGALHKFDGTNFVLTEGWKYYHDTSVLDEAPLGKHIVYQWWNQFRKTRAVIETDIQGLRTTAIGGTPGMIHRWKILHGDQEDKKFMLTSFRGMDFRTCGWNGVFVETSEVDGDRNYDDEFSFKYIPE